MVQLVLCPKLVEPAAFDPVVYPGLPPRRFYKRGSQLVGENIKVSLVAYVLLVFATSSGRSCVMTAALKTYQI